MERVRAESQGEQVSAVLITGDFIRAGTWTDGYQEQTNAMRNVTDTIKTALGNTNIIAAVGEADMAPWDEQSKGPGGQSKVNAKSYEDFYKTWFDRNEPQI